MSWFDVTGVTTFAKSALKEAQRTIDKALDIDENQENATPTSTPTSTPSSISTPQTPSVSSEKIKQQSEDFFAAFGLTEKKKSPLTPSNSVVDSTQAEETSTLDTVPTNESSPEILSKLSNEKCPENDSNTELGALEEDGDKKSSNPIINSSLWGSFTGSFFEAKLKAESKDDAEDVPDSSTMIASKSCDDIVATQPPRSSNSLPNIKSPPVSQQPHSTKSSTEDAPVPLQQQQISVSESQAQPADKTPPDPTDVGEWGWGSGWDSSIMVMSQQSPEEFDDKFDSLADDSIDVEGFAKSRLVVGSIDSDTGGFSRQGSYTDPNFSSAIVEDVFSDVEEKLSKTEKAKELQKEGMFLEQEHLDKKSVHKSEGNTPDSIVVLNSNSLSEQDLSTNSNFNDAVSHVGRDRTNLTVDLQVPVDDRSPFSSPDSIEVLGSSSLVTSPSSIEILSGPSSSYSSPDHQDSLTITQDLDPFITPAPTGVETEVIVPTTTTRSPVVTTQPPAAAQETQKQQIDTTPMVTACKPPVSCNSSFVEDSSIVAQQPASSCSSNEASTSVELVALGHENSQCSSLLSLSGSISSTVTSVSTSLSLSEDTSESMASTSSTHTVLDSSITTNLPQRQGLLDTITSQPEYEVGLTQNSRNLPETHQQVPNTHEMSTKVDKSTDVAKDHGNISGPEEVADEKQCESETRQMINEPSEEDTNVSSSSGDHALDVSVESAGSSDTITTSNESQQIILSSRMQGGGSDEEYASILMTGSGGSFVRCLLEEAMGDEETKSGTGTGSSSTGEREHSPSSSERSEAIKISSGHTSGQSSGDEIETTTSSDIEVISSPSLDGGSTARSHNSSSRVYSSSQRALRSFLNDRSDSPASDSSVNHKKSSSNDKAETVPSSMTTSFTSISESEGDSSVGQLFGGRLGLDMPHINLMDGLQSFEKGHRRNQSNFSETSESSTENSPEVEKLLKKMAQMAEVLEAREAKLMELSQVNVQLQDTNFKLKSHVEELEGGSGNDPMEILREEFTQRLVTMERKFQQSLREKEAIKKQLEEVRAEAATRLSAPEVARDLEERDSIIKELRGEGEKLSKQQGNYSSALKKLRTKDKENETTVKTQRDKLEEQSRELERLRMQLSAKEEVERRQIDAVRQYTQANQNLDINLKDAHAENAELEGKMSVLKSALDAAYKEVAELQRSMAENQAAAQEEVLSAEISARQQLEQELQETKTRTKQEQEALLAQVHELQDSVSQSEKQTNRREKQLRSEIGELQQRVNEAEDRAEELSSAVSAATRPLLRQMENLQSTQSVQQSTWEGLEASLSKRLSEAQAVAASSSEKERAAREAYAESMAEVASLQAQVSRLQAENTRLSTQVDLLNTRIDSVEGSRVKENTQVVALKTSFAEEISEIKRERDSLEQQLEMEKTAITAEKKKSTALQEQLKDRERKLLAAMTSSNRETSVASTPRSSPTPSLSRISTSGSLNESFTASQWGDEVFEAGWAGAGRVTSLYDTVRGTSTSTVEALSSQLRQREGEVHHLRSEVTGYEAQRESLAQELVALANQVETLTNQVANHQVLVEQYQDLEQRYNALLQMHGEKVEEVEELRLDLAEVKEMYKAQIDQLLGK